MSIFLIVVVFLLCLERYTRPRSAEPSSYTNLYYKTKEHPKNQDEIYRQITKPATVSYIMDHGTSIFHTHEYCYLSYLQMELAGQLIGPSNLFDHYSLTFHSAPKVSPAILAAAESYLSDREQYLGFLN